MKHGGFEFVTSAPHYQRGNRKAEAAVTIAKKLIKKADESNKALWYMFLHWRNTPNKVESSPAQRIFSRKTRAGLPTTLAQLRPKVVENVSKKIEDRRKISKGYYDRKAKQLPSLEAGQSVAVQVHPEKSNLWTNEGQMIWTRE